MLIPMLKMALRMLDGCNKDKIDCAKNILEEIIKDMESRKTQTYYSVKTEADVVLDGNNDIDLDPEALAAKEDLM